MLSLDRYGPQDGRPLLIVHGLFGSARNWGVIAKRLSADRPVIALDMRNHGESGWTETHGYPELAEDLAGVIAESGGTADVLGHSMGGKAAMVLALTRPDLVNRLVVADIAPVAYDHTQMHLIAAMKGLDLTGLTRRSEADSRLSGAVDEAGIRAFLLQSLDLKSDPPKWRLNLETLGREMPKILSWPEIEGSYEGPVLFLSGGDSDYVRQEHREKIRGLFPAARFAKIPGVGHWLHAEKPREFEASIAAFLDRA